MKIREKIKKFIAQRENIKLFLCLEEELELMRRHSGDAEFGSACKGIICAIENVQEERTPVGNG